MDYKLIVEKIKIVINDWSYGKYDYKDPDEYLVIIDEIIAEEESGE
ncbi:hypothetical protein LCGC14_2464080 [marine sediment metagenome]|uniref:Uncharacterized protein n=1 Tax=marine sediment metagenome TaxID=412755 RepID=A0A0F9C037_9ZZZZ